jgi:NAD-dependent dihydropyrimidine dehydrogenase PreA subunit
MLQMLGKLIKKLNQRRGYLHNDLDKCFYCGKCEGCRAKAIKVDKTSKKWKCEDDKCHRCGHCVNKCPAKSLRFVEKLD